jgi:hypothetical protein
MTLCNPGHVTRQAEVERLQSRQPKSGTEAIVAGGMVIGFTLSPLARGKGAPAGVVVETASPKALPSGPQPRALIGPAGDPGLTGGAAPSGARFIAGEGGILDLQNPLGNLNTAGNHGPIVVTPSGIAATTAEMQALARARQALTAPGATPNSKGVAGEDFLRDILGGQGTPHAPAVTPGGIRFIDRRVGGNNLEVKNTTRPQPNNAFYRKQILKEQQQLQAKTATSSTVIAVNGVTRPAAAQAKAAGVDVIDLRELP